MLKNYQSKIKSDEGGWFLVSAIVMIMFLTLIGFTLSALISLQYQHTRREEYVQNAQLAAEAGIEQSVNALNASSTFTGYSTPQTFFNNSVQGMGSFTTSITKNADGKSRTIISTGNVYRSATDTIPYITRGVKVTIVGTQSSGYSVLTGPGGLILGGNAAITNSNVYASGTIQMSGNSSIGTYNQPVNVDVANNACPNTTPPGDFYPQVCSNGSQPITFSRNSTIYGSVCATGQTSTGPNNNIQIGSGGNGLESGCTAPVSSPPTYDRLAQIGAVTTTASGSAACNTAPYNGTWPANLEFTGDVSIGSHCSITLSGNVYITGNLTINGSSTITVSNTLGATRPVIMVDGTITVNGSASLIANSSGAGIEFISFMSSEPCTIGTTTATYCATLTGNDLWNSQSLSTITVSGGINIPGMVFDAYWSEVTLSGSGIMGAATGQTVNLQGSGAVVFGTSLASNTQTWIITSYVPNYAL